MVHMAAWSNASEEQMEITKNCAASIFTSKQHLVGQTKATKRTKNDGTEKRAGEMDPNVPGLISEQTKVNEQKPFKAPHRFVRL